MAHELQRDSEHLVVKVEGKLDARSAPVLEHDMAVQLDGVQDITFELCDLIYVSSAGLRVLLASYKLMTKREGTMRLVNVGEDVMSILEASGFAQIFPIE